MIFLAEDQEYEVMVTQQSIIEIDVSNLPAKGQIAIRHAEMVMECVSLKLMKSLSSYL